MADDSKPVYDFIGLNSLDFKAPVETAGTLQSSLQPSFFVEEETQKEERGGQGARLLLLKYSLERILKDIQRAIELIGDEIQSPDTPSLHETDFMSVTEVLNTASSSLVSSPPHQESSHGEKIIEGVFDGERMVCSDGQRHSIPPNYASKSKLVEGDVMKLTISSQGSFLFKQIGPIERRRIMATLEQHSHTREYCARIGEQQWKILTASVTYYRGVPGDEVILLVPKQKSSKWGAVENIIKKFT